MSSLLIKRRSFLSAGCAALASSAFGAELPNPRGVSLVHEPLSFAPDALHPFLSADCVRNHYALHGEHVEKLRVGLRRARVSVANVVSLMGSPHNHGGAHINHTAFWRFLTPPGSGPSAPEGKLAGALDDEFSHFRAFKAAFAKAALNHVGSGWAWLVCRPDSTLIICTTANEDNPLMRDRVAWQDFGRPILCLDLWEHSYCSRYKDDREEYIDNWWKVVNWNAVARAYTIVTSGRV